MSKQATPPPPGDKPKPSAPPPPPTWRNWLWPIMIFAIFALWLFLPTRTTSTSLSYSQFLSDVSAHQVKTIEIASTQGGTSSGTLTDGKNYTVVIPPQAGPELLTTLQNEKVQISSAPSGEGFGTEVLIYLIVFGLPILLFVWLFRRISQGRGRRAAGRHGRGPVPGQGVRRGTALHHVRRRGRLRGRQVRDLRGGGLPQEPGPVRPGRRDGAPRRPHGRAARHRQDPAGPRGGRRGARAVLLRERVQLRGAVRRGRRGPGPRPVRRGAQARARHHLHRRDRRHRPAPLGGRRRVRRQRRTGADAQPAAGRDGRLRAVIGHRGARGDEPAGDPRPGPAPSGPVRPAGDDPAAERHRAGRDPGRALPWQEAGRRRGPERHRPRHPRLLRRRPGQPGQRGRHQRGA